MPRLKRSFFERPTVEVARALLGQRLVRVWNEQRLAGLISETEAYVGEADLACHARVGRTARNAVMFGPPGYAYVYFTYGMHWMLNCVTERADFAAAVLIRGIWPAEGVSVMRRKRGPVVRGKPDWRMADGPAKLTQALALDGHWNGSDLCAPGAELFIEAEDPVSDDQVIIGPRIGLGQTPEPWLSMAWNFKLVR